jgi:hypothetical protein
MLSFAHNRGRILSGVLVLVSTLLVATLFVPALGAFARDSEGREGREGRKALEFDTMAPVTGAFVGMNNPVRGFDGGGLPWVIASGEGELSANGELEVHVRGLVLDPNDPRVPANLKGVNPFNAFGVFVSCLTNADPKGLDPHTAVAAGNFPATSPGGNMHAEPHITLPSGPCVAPTILVTSPAPAGTAAWFAATGVLSK